MLKEHYNKKDDEVQVLLHDLDHIKNMVKLDAINLDLLEKTAITLIEKIRKIKLIDFIREIIEMERLKRL